MKYSLKGSTHEDLVTRIFENRNVNIEDKKTFLNPTKNDIQPPQHYLNMENAYDTLMETIKCNGLILILVDSDADGYCSAATLINYLRFTLKYKNILFLLHNDKEHGLTKSVMEKILTIRPDLLIIPDAASNEFKQHEILCLEGIKTIIIDHHECDKYSQHAIVINNQLNEIGNKSLSGAGMVLKFIEYIDQKLGLEQSEFYYDLVAVALVADSMLMTNPETRYYVLEGMDNINNPFLKLLTEEMSDSTFEHISFKIAPIINAVIRVGKDEDKFNLMSALICEERNEIINLRGQGNVELPLVEYIIKIADRLKAKQTREIKKLLEDEETIILTEHYPITFMIHENDNAQALSGLIASKLVHQYGKPALVLKKFVETKETADGEKTEYVRYAGSGRSTPTFTDFRGYLNRTDKFMYCEGHAGAFGASIKEQQLSEILKILLYQSLPIEESSVIVDKAYPEGGLSSMDIFAVDELKQYWCKGFEKPKFYIKLSGVRGSDISQMGANGKSIKITHEYISYVKFNCTNEELNLLLDNKVKDIELIGTFNINEWNGRSFPQVLIEKIEIKDNDSIEDIDFADFNAFAV